MSPIHRVAMVLATLYAAPSPATAQPYSDDQLAWFTGCWQILQGDRVIDEQWMAPGGGLMLGMSRTVRAGRTSAIEFITLRVVEGRFVYEANPSGQRPTPFTATFVSAERAVFENPAHDFPKRIIYERKGDAALVASIDDGTGTKRVEYSYHRVACG